MIELIRRKIQDVTSAQRTLSAWRVGGQQIVFTNGALEKLRKK